MAITYDHGKLLLDNLAIAVGNGRKLDLLRKAKGEGIEVQPADRMAAHQLMHLEFVGPMMFAVVHSVARQGEPWKIAPNHLGRALLQHCDNVTT